MGNDDTQVSLGEKSAAGGKMDDDEDQQQPRQNQNLLHPLLAKALKQRVGSCSCHGFPIHVRQPLLEKGLPKPQRCLAAQLCARSRTFLDLLL